MISIEVQSFRSLNTRTAVSYEQDTWVAANTVWLQPNSKPCHPKSKNEETP